MIQNTSYPDSSYRVHAARQGNLSAFNDLVLENQDAAFNLAYFLLGDKAAAEDVIQNSFLAAYLKLHTFRGGSFRAWLLKIIQNACYDELRRRKRHPTLPLEPSDDGEDAGLYPMDVIPDNHPSPEQEFEDREQRRLVREAVARLPQEFRDVIVLVDLGDMDYQEAAQVLGKPIGTVKSRLARGRLRLQDTLSEVRQMA